MILSDFLGFILYKKSYLFVHLSTRNPTSNLISMSFQNMQPFLLYGLFICSLILCKKILGMFLAQSTLYTFICTILYMAEIHS